MELPEAVAFIRDAVGDVPGNWADVGAGSGTFTRALLEILGPGSRIYAVDRDAASVESLARWAATQAPNVRVVEADFTQPFVLPGVASGELDGILLANALHFVRDAEGVLTRLATLLRAGGRVVFVEYDRREASRWVPHPVPRARLTALAESAGLTTPVVTATRPSEYQGVLYVAWATRPTLP